jgi:hypothetical protein
VLGLLTFALIPVHINTIYSGLPAHPLFLHVPVILSPVAVIAALVLVVRPRWFAGHGVWVALVAIVSLGATNLTMGAGKALRNDLHLNGGFGPAALVARHAHAASILRILLIAFTAVLIVSVAVFRTADRRAPGSACSMLPWRRSAPRSRCRRRSASCWPAWRWPARTSYSTPGIWAPRRSGRVGSGAATAPGSSRAAAAEAAVDRRACSPHRAADQSSRTSAPWDSNGARRTLAQPSTSRPSRSITGPVWS